MKTSPRPFEWDWHGACLPGSSIQFKWRYRHFSVGCFQWMPKKSGTGLKRGKAAKRFVGACDNPEPTYAEAQAWCDAKNRETVN